MGRNQFRQMLLQRRGGGAGLEPGLQRRLFAGIDPSRLDAAFVQALQQFACRGFGGKAAEDDFEAAVLEGDDAVVLGAEAGQLGGFPVGCRLVGQVGDQHQVEWRFLLRQDFGFAAEGFDGGLQGLGSGHGQAADQATDRLLLLRRRRLDVAHDAQFVGLELLRQPLRFAAVVGCAEIALCPGKEDQVGKHQQEEEKPNGHAPRQNQDRRERHRAARRAPA